MSLQSPLCIDMLPSCIIVQCVYLYIDEIKSQNSDILLVCLLSFQIEQTEVIENSQNEWGRNKAISSILYHILSFFLSFFFHSWVSAKHFAAHTHTIFHEYVTSKDRFLTTD